MRVSPRAVERDEAAFGLVAQRIEHQVPDLEVRSSNLLKPSPYGHVAQLDRAHDYGS